MPNDTVLGYCDSSKVFGAQVSGGVLPYDFAWSPSGTSEVDTNFDSNDSTMRVVPVNGETTYILEVTDANGCSVVDSFDVYVDSLAITDITTDTVGYCDNAVSLSASLDYLDSAGVGDTTILWLNTTGLSATDITSPTLDATVLTADLHEYPVKVTDSLVVRLKIPQASLLTR